MNGSMRVFGGCFFMLSVATSLLGCSDEATQTASTSGSTTGGNMNIKPGSVVINEIEATVEDWIEIANVGTEVADLSGYGLTDKMADGTPEVADAVRFVEGEKLAPGEYLLVVANLKTAMAGPQTTCLMSGGPSRCYQGKWGVSATNGDRLFLLYPNDTILDTVTYPIDGAPMGQSYCRLPNGTGDFAACKSTPAATNSAP